MPDVKVTILIDQGLYKEIKSRSHIEGFTIKGFIKNASDFYLDHLEKEEDKMRKAGMGRFRIAKDLKK